MVEIPPNPAVELAVEPRMRSILLGMCYRCQPRLTLLLILLLHVPMQQRLLPLHHRDRQQLQQQRQQQQQTVP